MPAGATQRGTLDVTGAITVTAGLAAVVFAVVRAPEAGWTSAGTVLSGLGGLLLLALFVVLQARLRHPLMRLGIFKAPNLAAANVAQLMLGAAWIPMFFFINLYLQQVLGLGAFASGAALLPLTLTIMVGMIVAAPRLIGSVRSQGDDGRGSGDPGGRAGLAVPDPSRRHLRGRRAARLAGDGGRDGDGVHPLPGHGALRCRPEGGGWPRDRQHELPGGSALGLAAMTAVASAFGADQVGDVQALTDGFSAGLVGAAGLAAAGALLAAVDPEVHEPASRPGLGAGEHHGRGELKCRAGAHRARRPDRPRSRLLAGAV